MIMTTTSSVEGYEITEYHGIAAGEAILGANIFKDIFAGLTDIIGGRSGSYERELAEARGIAMQELRRDVTRLGGNAAVGVDLDYEVIGSGQAGNMMMVSASGTSVTLRKRGP